MKRLLLSASETAKLILLNAADYEADQREKKPLRRIDVKRFILSERSLKRLCFRYRLDYRFLNQLTETMLDLGWFMIPTGDSSYIFLRASATENWPKIGSRARDDDSTYEVLRKDTIRALRQDNVRLLNKTMDDIDEEIKHLIDDNFEAYDYSRLPDLDLGL
ncbi:hypothetical protein VXS05_04295 [Photobacterium toruni]|uniref:hypothetical protein n=1 Tax=Photobacterium toruni TaxID=1935446 RepID=UPI002E185897|nr:hypothetical protein [Photobacterium toruni]